MLYLTVPERTRAPLLTKSSCGRCTDFRFDNKFKLLKGKGTLVSFGNAPGRFAGKNIKLLRPGAMNYMVTPEEGAHNSILFFDAVSKGTLYEYPFIAEGVQQAQADLPHGKSTGKLIVRIGDYTHGDARSTHGMACVPMYSSAGRRSDERVVSSVQSRSDGGSISSLVTAR